MIKISSDNLWFTSDSHYNHKNKCRGISQWENLEYTRDFKDIVEMNDAIVNRINDNIGENDIMFHLGDWSFGGKQKVVEFRERIKCKNIVLILGNHDTHIRADKDLQSLFKHIADYEELKILTLLSDGVKKALGSHLTN